MVFAATGDRALTSTQLLRVQCFNVSTDGFDAGEGQSLERPFGHANPAEIFSWAGTTASWVNRADPGGTRGLDDYFTRDMPRNVGAAIMGRNKFGPQRGSWQNHDWKGWWGDTPPFHTPVFVLTHHERPSFTLADTTFHFIDAAPAVALQQAKRPLGHGRSPRWRLGNHPRVPRSRPCRHDAHRCRTDRARSRRTSVEFAQRVPRSLPRGLRAQPSGVTHLLFWRR